MFFDHVRSILQVRSKYLSKYKQHEKRRVLTGALLNPFTLTLHVFFKSFVQQGRRVRLRGFLSRNLNEVFRKKSYVNVNVGMEA